MTGTKGVRAHRAQSYASIERIASHVRTHLLPGHADVERVIGLELFERLDEYQVAVGGRAIPLQYGVADMPPGLEAQASYEEDEGAIVVTLNHSTYDELHAGAGRALFTLAHEIGHAVLHPQELVDRRLAHVDSRSLDRGAAGEHKPYLDTEWQANGFAAAMLMPASGLARLQARGRLDPPTVAELYGVSLPAAELRQKIFLDRHRELLG